jgi:NOL1/NOP2/sun family putative RNA methylase
VNGVKNVLPEQLLQSLQTVNGFDRDRFVDVHETGEQVVSLRFNPSKINPGEEKRFPGSEKIPWSSYGYYLPSRPSFTLDPLLHGGVYYVQEASSMFIEQCLSQHTDLSATLKVLDLCAAPGGKSTLIQSLISDESLLVSNEVIKTRVSVLTENLSKWGAPNTIVTNNDPRDFGRIENYFDVMVADAPCSGSGLFRRDMNAVSEWSSDAVTMCSQRQQRILSDALPALNNGGLLVYSTCSYSKEENEEICDWLCEKYSVTPLALNISPEWNVVETESDKFHSKGYRFFPDKTRGEGFFVACFRKKDSGEDNSSTYKKKKLVRATASEIKVIEKWIEKPDRFNYYHLDQDIFAFPRALSSELEIIHANLYTKKAGVMIGRIIKNDLLPAHDLAVSTIVNRQLLSISLKLEDALQYLRKEEVKQDTDTKGWALVKYEGHNLGWIKLLGNRTNNYYPKEWRILKSGSN